MSDKPGRGGKPPRPRGWFSGALDALSGRHTGRRKNDMTDQNPDRDPINPDAQAGEPLEGTPEATPENPDDFEGDFAAQAEELMRRLARVDELENELLEARGKLSRLLADFENYRRRTAQDVLAEHAKGAAEAVQAVLPVLDDISRALDAGVKDPATLIPGFKAVRENFSKALGRFGLETTPGEGAPFDPNLHEALSTVPAAEDGVVAQVYQPGYLLNGKLVRPGRVVVTRKES
ncbi:MAG TPA: nucleotide exchange factor GrpE [Deinococcales bacterium]|nr:nucleotide exchange factor GrpE [Deinococcales bacterium]